MVKNEKKTRQIIENNSIIQNAWTVFSVKSRVQFNTSENHKQIVIENYIDANKQNIT